MSNAGGRFLVAKNAAKCYFCRTNAICRMDLSQATFSVSEAARLLGVNRRTIQRWVRAGALHQWPSGRVTLEDAAKLMARKKRAGRPAKGTLWKSPLFWGLRDTPAAEQARRYLTPAGLKELQQMLAVVAHWHTIEGTENRFQTAMDEVIKLAQSMQEKKRTGDIAWQVAAKRFIQR